jgi:hypothetical protein
LTPVDVVKTRIQLEPEVFNRVSASTKEYRIWVDIHREWSVVSDRSLPRRELVLF